MNKKLLIGIIVVLGIAASIFQPMFIGVVFIGVCIYLVFMVWKKKTSLFHDQVEPKSAQRRLKMLKVFLLVAAISLAVSIFCAVLHAVVGAMLEEELFSFVTYFIALVALWVSIIATIGGLVIFLKGRRKTT